MRAYLLAGLLVLAGSACAQSVSKVAGTWKYDMNSIRFVLDPKLQQQMKTNPQAAKEGPKVIASQEKMIKDVMATMRLTFSADKHFSAKSTKTGTAKHGTWSLKGSHVIIKMSDGTTSAPNIELAKDGKSMSVSYFGAGFGTMYGKLIRA